MRIIGILGLISSGKDTIGEYLVKNHNFVHDNLAKPLKDVASTIFSWDRLLLEGQTVESRQWRDQPDVWWEKELNWKDSRLGQIYPHFTPRVCLQLFGTELFRDSFHSDIWILSLKNRLLKYRKDTVITDCRFPNECKVISELGGLIIRVQRGPNPTWVDYIKCQIAFNSEWQNVCGAYGVRHSIHPSEWMSFAYKEDILLHNNGTINDLHTKVEEVLTSAYIV